MGLEKVGGSVHDKEKRTTYLVTERWTLSTKGRSGFLILNKMMRRYVTSGLAWDRYGSMMFLSTSNNQKGCNETFSSSSLKGYMFQKRHYG